MNLQTIIHALHLKVLTPPRDFVLIEVAGGYASDLLSCVMAGAQRGNVWVTLQAHINVVAVAQLQDIAAVLITENAQPDAATLHKANTEGVILLSTPLKTYEVVGRLWEMGVR
jgi:hypothetical protein